MEDAKMETREKSKQNMNIHTWKEGGKGGSRKSGEERRNLPPVQHAIVYVGQELCLTSALGVTHCGSIAEFTGGQGQGQGRQKATKEQPNRNEGAQTWTR